MPDDFGRFEDEIRNGLNGDNAAQDWDSPMPFSNVETLPFPVESLPGPLMAFVEHLSETTQTPEEMSALLGLGVLATAFQPKFDVQINADWTEPLCLYTVAVAPPAERKSAVIAALTRPVYEYEEERRTAEAGDIARNQTERALLEGRLQAVKQQAARGKEGGALARQEALDLSAQLAEFQELHPFRLLADDSTPEKLAELMSSQGGCITVCSAEGGVFDALTGRYDNKGGLDVYLKGHAGDPILVDRIGRGANSIPHPRLTMMLTVQPEVLNGLMSNTTFRGRGLCGRFLYAICQSKVGHRKVSPSPMPEKVKTDYRAFVRRILSMPYKGTITMSPEAGKLRESYQEYIENKLGDGWESLRDWGGKLVGAMVRIAALIHAAEIQGDPTLMPISVDTVGAAINIAEFLSTHAEAAYQVMGGDPEIANAQYVWRRLENSGKDEISKRDLFRLCRGRFKRADEIDAPLRVLTEYGYVRIEVTERDGAGRKASPVITVNPLTTGHNGHN